nr:DUF2470 domain-containing protein [Prescottella equi]
MNGDHTEDNLLIVRAFAEPDATAARMTGLDGRSGEWVAEVDGVDRTVRVPWLGPVTSSESRPTSTDRPPAVWSVRLQRSLRTDERTASRGSRNCPHHHPHGPQAPRLLPPRAA